MFRGINAINLDPKGRMSVPTRYREQLINPDCATVIITIDTDARCLLLYPLKEWEIIERKVAALPSFNSATRRIQRLLIGHATDVDMDNNGRILLPPLLREYAKLSKCVVLVGQRNKFEIWDDQEWLNGRAQWISEEAKSIADLPADLQDLAL